MDYLDIGFTLLMILFPALFTLFVKAKAPHAEARALNRRLTRLLWLATGIAVVAYAGLYSWRPAVAYFMWMAFFPLWFLLVMPVLGARDAGWLQPERGAVRSASLARRDELPRALRVAWIMLTVVWLLLFAVTVLGLLQTGTGMSNPWLLAFNLLAGGEIWLLHWAMRRSVIEAEAVSPSESDDLRAARENLRRFKLNGWLAVAVMMVLVFSLPPLLLAWYGRDLLLPVILIGAGGGALAGIGGGIFGTLASIKRARINRLHTEALAGISGKG